MEQIDMEVNKTEINWHSTKLIWKLNSIEINDGDNIIRDQKHWTIPDSTGFIIPSFNSFTWYSVTLVHLLDLIYMQQRMLMTWEKA